MEHFCLREKISDRAACAAGASCAAGKGGVCSGRGTAALSCSSDG